MTEIEMEAELRTAVGKGPNRRLRRDGKIPGVLYGAGKDAVAVSLDVKPVLGVIRSHGGVNTIFQLKLKGAKGSDSVMIKEYQIEPVEHRLLHADLVRVAMDKELTLSVAVELTGTAVGVKTGGGMLDFIHRTVDISCLPTDIPETLVASVEELDIGDYLRAKDLDLPKGVTMASEQELVIAHVIPPRVEEEVTEAAEGELAEGEEGAAAATEKEGAKGEEEGSGGDGEKKPAK